MTATKEPAKFRALLHQPAPKSMMDTHADTHTHTHRFLKGLPDSLFDAHINVSPQRPVWTCLICPPEPSAHIHTFTAHCHFFFSPRYADVLACTRVCVCSEPTSSSGSGLRSHCLPSWRLTSHSFTHKYCDRCPPAPREAYAGLLYTIIHATPPVKLRQVESRILLRPNPCDIQRTLTSFRHSHRTYLHQNRGFIENNTLAFPFLSFFFFFYIYWRSVMQMAWFVFRWRILLTVGINNHRKMKG